MLCGKNVFFYTMELNEMYVGKRFDSHLTEIPTIECGKRIVELKDWFERNRDVLGELIIKQFPSKKITINTIRAHIEAMACKNKRPDLIIVDYAGIMRSTQKYELPRFEMQAVIQELRTLSQEFGLPLWTALQSNKEGAKSEMIDTTNMAESYGQAAEADFIMGLQRPSAQKSTGYGNLFVAKNRMGMDGMPPWKIHLNTGTSTLKVLTEKDVETMEKTIAISDEEEAREVLSKMKDSVSKYKNRFTKLSDDE
jgi:replicative DNA helicase